MLKKYTKKSMLLLIVFLFGAYLLSLPNSFTFTDGMFTMGLLYVFSMLSIFIGESPTTRDSYKNENLNYFARR